MRPSAARVFGDLQSHGYAILTDLVDSDLLDAFERTMETLATAQLATKGVTATAPEPLIDLLQIGGAYRRALFNMFKHLRIVQEMSHRVAGHLDLLGFFDWSSQSVPMIWPSLRVDLPGEKTYLLPMHQDYASTKCHNAWRLWIPLREVDTDTGTMAIVPGSHKLGRLEHDTSDPHLPHVPKSRYEHLSSRTLELKAGDGVLFDPLLLHASVAGQGLRIKYVLLIQIQDLTTLADPDDSLDPITQRLKMAEARDACRAAAEKTTTSSKTP